MCVLKFDWLSIVILSNTTSDVLSILAPLKKKTADSLRIFLKSYIEIYPGLETTLTH